MGMTRWQIAGGSAAGLVIIIAIAWAAFVSEDAVTFLLTALKFLAIAFTGIFGAMGLLTESRDKEGHITVWGRRALTGLIISVLLSALTQAFEVLKQNNDAAAQIKKQTVVLNEINRTLNPLPPDDLVVSFKISVAASQPLMQSYANRLNGYPPSYPSKSKTRLDFFTSDEQAPLKSDGSEFEIWKFFASKVVGLRIYAHPPIPPASGSAKWPEPDLQFYGDATLKGDWRGLLFAPATVGKPFYANSGFTYDKATGILEYHVANLKPKYMHDNGTLRSTLDFPGAFVVVSFTHANQGRPLEDTDPETLDFSLASLELKLSTNRKLVSTNFQKRTDGPVRTFTTTIPKDLHW